MAWWEKKLPPRQRQEIEQLATGMSRAEQETFVKWVEDWIREPFQQRGFQPLGVGRVVLVQLAQIPLFQSWEPLKPYRLENLKGVNALILQSENLGQCDDVKPWIVMLIPKEGNAPTYAWLNVNVSDAPLEKAWSAVLSLLTGMGLLLLLGLWAMFGRKPHRWWMLLRSGWVVVGSILFLLLIPFPFVDALLVPMLWILVVVTGFLVLYGVWSKLREALCAWKWARLLRQSQLYVLVGGVQVWEPVEGPSFGGALCLSILLALHEECPATVERSWLWWQILEELVKRLPNWAITEEVTAWGWVKPVRRLKHKIEACLDHPGITDLITPVQDEARPRVVQRTQPAISPSNSVGQAAGVSELQLHRCWHIAQVLIVMGGLVNASATARNIVLTLFLAVIVVASPHICWILHPSPNPEWIFERCGFGHIPTPGPFDDRLILVFKTGSPTRFGVILNSLYWANRENRLYTDPENPHFGRVELELVKLEQPPVDDPYNGQLQVIRYRKFLFRSLPPVIIEHLTLWHCLKTGWDTRPSENIAVPRPYAQGFETLPPFH